MQAEVPDRILTERESTVFGGFARYYDMLYHDKDYAGECDFLEAVLGRLRRRKIEILDAGCGTGSHSVLMAKRGFSMTGIDSSAEMLTVARRKGKRLGVNVDFKRATLINFNLHRTFDACICMFAVLDYLTDDSGLGKALSSIRKHLKVGSFFVFDFWYGPAVVSIRPSQRFKLVRKRDLEVVRLADPKLIEKHNICEVSYHMFVMRRHRVLYAGDEIHTLRYFFPYEIEKFLRRANFTLIKICTFARPKEPASEETWNAVGIARAK